MSIKAAGGVFGRNPTFNDVTVEGDLSIDGTLSVGGNVLSGLDFEGAWDATSGAPSATPSTGQFWIVSVAGTTNLSGITNWGIGDWALYDGSDWKRIEGGANGNFKELTSSSTTVLNGTTIPASKTLVVTTDIGSTVEAYDATILKSADIGSTVQGYDADTAKYDDTTANFTGTLQSGGNNVLTTASDYLDSSDIGSTVQGYDADTAKYDDATAAFTGNLSVDTNTFYANATDNEVCIGTTTSINAGKLNVKADSAHNGICTTPYANSYYNYYGTNTAGTRTFSVRGDGISYFAGEMTVAAQLNNTGNHLITNGNLVIGTSGKGIDFSATSGTGTSELFDDYEEGTFTPVINSYGTGPTVTYTSQVGTYTKIGNLVTVKVSIGINTYTAGTGNARVEGLPFNVGTAGMTAAAVQGVNWGASATQVMAFNNDTDRVRLSGYLNNAGNVSVTSADLAAGDSIVFVLQYWV